MQYCTLQAFEQFRALYVHNHDVNPSKKNETSIPCWTNVGPTSMTLDQHWPNIRSMSRV